MNNIAKLISSKHTVFTVDELKKLFSDYSQDGLNNFLRRAKNNNILYNVRNGIRVLPNYDTMELACKIKKQAYISLEYVLFKEGVIFQYYNDIITATSDDSRTYQIDNREYRYSKIKNDILMNPIGIKTYDNYRIATLERALCDLVYLNPNMTALDNPEGINKRRLELISPIYPQSTRLYIKKIFDNVG